MYIQRIFTSSCYHLFMYESRSLPVQCFFFAFMSMVCVSAMQNVWMFNTRESVLFFSVSVFILACARFIFFSSVLFYLPRIKRMWIVSNPFHIVQWKMEFSYGFTTVRHAHFHMQANRIDFSLFVFEASSFTHKACLILYKYSVYILHCATKINYIPTAWFLLDSDRVSLFILYIYLCIYTIEMKENSSICPHLKWNELEEKWACWFIFNALAL